MNDSVTPARTPEQKFILLFEAAKRSLLAADHLFRELSATVGHLEADIVASRDVGERAIPALISAVALVDFAHRFKELVDALPLVNKKHPSMRAIRRALAGVEAARHYLQHMRRDLSSPSPIEYPLLGALSWTNGNFSYTVFLSQISRATVSSIVFDRRDGKWLTRHQFTVQGRDLDLDAIVEAMHAAYQWLTSTAKFSDPAFADLTWGSTHAIGMQLTVSDAPSASDDSPAGPTS